MAGRQSASRRRGSQEFQIVISQGKDHDLQALNKVANELVSPGRGILAADESTSSITKRFNALKVESTEITRRDYREMLFRTPGFGENLSGVILYDENDPPEGRRRNTAGEASGARELDPRHQGR